MAYLSTIVTQIEKEFHVHVHGPVKSSERIESVQFLLPSSLVPFNPMPFTLYVGNYQDFCLHSIDYPALLLNSKTATVNENALHIYKDLNPLEICNCIQRELLRSHQTNLKKEEMFHILQAGHGIQSIINTARTLLHNPITICNTSFSIIALSPKDDNNDNFELYNDYRYLKNASLQNMRNKQVMTRIFESTTPFVIYFDDEPDTAFLFCGIHIKRAAVGYICLRDIVRPFTDDDIKFVVDVSKMLSIEMQKNDFFSQKSGLKYEYFLTDLIEHNLDNIEFATHRLEQLGQVFYNYFWVCAFSFSGESTNQLNPKYYIDQLLGIFRNGMTFFYKGTLVLLLTGNHLYPFNNTDTQKFEHFLQLNQMHMAISYRYENLLETSLYYDQAVYLLKSGHTKLRERTYFYEDNYLYHLLECAPDQLTLKTLVHPDITFLLDYDKSNSTDYTRTLAGYFENNRNALRTANYLHIHKSTFFYRLGKIVELINLELDNPKSLFAYEFSFAIINYIKSR